MAASLEWDIAYELETPAGSIFFNTDDQLGSLADGGLLLLDNDDCRMGAPLRTSLDDVPQSDGAIPHPVLESGYEISLGFRLATDRESPACDENLVLLNDMVSRLLNSLRPEGEGRLKWNPSGSTPERMVDDLWLYGQITPTWDGVWTKLACVLRSSFPYAIDQTETTTTITTGNSSILVNDGSHMFWPVIKAYGPTSLFTITNTGSVDEDGNPRVLTYDAALPGATSIGGGDYVEFDFFRNTAYLNGTGANRKAGIDMEVSDFFPIEVGANEIFVSGCTIDILWQSAWV